MSIPLITKAGFICRHTRSSGFKLALVVGFPDSFDKLRVRVWRAASKQWTQPQLVKKTELARLTDEERKQRIALIRRAATTAIDLDIVDEVQS
jgi:tRNA(Leu) C34 or U34 (ribose-2'-O)-methylase TrmL